MNERILIVEDEAITALDLKYSLEELGYEIVDTVDTGQDAIDTAAETVPDVVLMDIKLKGDMEGIEAAEVISELRIPIIYLTANTDTDTFEKSNVKDLTKLLQHLCDNPDIIKKYQEVSQEYILNSYSWDDVVDKTIKLYEK